MKRSQPGATFPPMGAGGANPPQHFRQWGRAGQIGRNITVNGSGRGKSAAPAHRWHENRIEQLIVLF